jgi:hypothetical protein
MAPATACACYSPEPVRRLSGYLGDKADICSTFEHSSYLRSEALYRTDRRAVSLKPTTAVIPELCKEEDTGKGLVLNPYSFWKPVGS